MRLPILSLCLMFLPLTAGAQEDPLSAGAFEARTTGQTLTYGLGGEVFGTEQYLPGRRVIWAFAGQGCQHGTWEDSDGLICFRYEGDPDPACWQFFDNEGRLVARLNSDPEGLPLEELAQSPEPMSCPGPDTGV